MANREKELEKEITVLKEQNAGLLKRVQELEGKVNEQKPSKSREQAEKVAAMLKEGPVTKTMLAALNQKYPSDPIYYAKTLLHLGVKKAKIGNETAYFSPEHFKVWEEGQAREKAAAIAAKAETPKEGPPPIETTVQAEVHA